MEGYDYEAAARTIKIEDITTDDTNREILRKLKEMIRILFIWRYVKRDLIAMAAVNTALKVLTSWDG